MVEFFRDVLSGPLYIIVAVLAIIFIMAIIGYLMEKKQLEKESKEKVAVISQSTEAINVTPIEPVTIQDNFNVTSNAPIETQNIIIEPPTPINVSIKQPENTFEQPQIIIEPAQVTIQPVSIPNQQNPTSNPINEEGNTVQEVKPNVIVFEDPDKKNV